MRSERLSSSSRSSDISRMAAPSPRRASSSVRTYSLAPTSSPRVGWETTSTCGSRDSTRARSTFWMLPPESVATRSSGRALMAKRSMSSSAWASMRLRSSRPPGAKSSMCSRTRLSATGRSSTRLAWRSSGMRPTPAAMTVCGSAPASSAPSTRMLPAITPRMPPSTSASSVWPLPETPATPTISPAWTSRLTSWRAGRP